MNLKEHVLEELVSSVKVPCTCRESILLLTRRPPVSQAGASNVGVIYVRNTPTPHHERNKFAKRGCIGYPFVGGIPAAAGQSTMPLLPKVRIVLISEYALASVPTATKSML